MKRLEGYDCDFCGQLKSIVCTAWGCFCKDCLQIMRDESTKAIETLEKEEEK